MSFQVYFNAIADRLDAEFRAATIPGHNADTGHNRETFCREFLAKHLSRRLCPELGGVVLAAGSAQSHQQDILICHDMSMVFRLNEKINIPVESLTGVVSVKSRLDKEGIYDALEGLATIPQVTAEVLRLGLLKRPVTEYAQSWPSLFVFGYSGVDLETCLGHMFDFYQARKNIPQNRQPRAVIVNKQYIVAMLHYETPLGGKSTGGQPLRLTRCTAETAGAPLFWLLCELTKGITWLDDMQLNFAPYFERSYPEDTLATNVDITGLIPKLLGSSGPPKDN